MYIAWACFRKDIKTSTSIGTFICCIFITTGHIFFNVYVKNVNLEKQFDRNERYQRSADCIRFSDIDDIIGICTPVTFKVPLGHNIRW